jgi:hypothetical protein
MADLTEEERRLLNELRKVIDRACKQVHQEEFGTLTQEPPLTATLAAAIRNELRHHPVIVGRLSVEVMSRNVPDRGRKSMESINGADLYISLVRRDKGISKGVLLQSKWEDGLYDGDNLLRNQALKMERRSDASFILVFGPRGIVAVPAHRATWPRVPTDFLTEGISVGKLIADGLACDRGDRGIGRDLDLQAPQGIDDVLRRISGTEQPALDFQVKRSVKSRIRSGHG